MSLLFQVVFSGVCRGTHPRLALDALRHLRGVESERWSDLFLHHHRAFVAGSRAPDDQFQDYKNHVLHVAEGGWGGAIEASRRWYGRSVDALRRQQWSEAVHALGVLSHYFSDPFMPLNTAQSEEGMKVHRPLQWSISKSYGELQHILDFDLGGYPKVEAPRRDDWLAHMIQQGATMAHEHYQVILDHYDLTKAVQDPRTGMDQECKDRIAKCLGAAVIGVARVFERAIEEAAVEPPSVETTLQGFLAMLAAPMRGLDNRAHDVHEWLVVESIFDEVERTGKVIQNLPDSNRTVRQLHADEVLKIPLTELDLRPAAVTGQLHGQGTPERYQPNHLITSPVIDNRPGPSIFSRSHTQRRLPVAQRL